MDSTTYLLIGRVNPERALISETFSAKCEHIATTEPCVFQVNIILNQISIVAKVGEPWDIFDLRNAVRYLIQLRLSIIGYLKGYSYGVEITRIICSQQNIDYVFGIDVEFLGNRFDEAAASSLYNKVVELSKNEAGLFIGRCLLDLRSSIDNSEDSQFYCYRALEALRHHCAYTHGISDTSISQQWKKFRDVANCTEENLRIIKTDADSIRHGNALERSKHDRSKIVQMAWSIADSYFKNA